MILREVLKWGRGWLAGCLFLGLARWVLRKGLMGDVRGRLYCRKEGERSAERWTYYGIDNYSCENFTWIIDCIDVWKECIAKVYFVGYLKIGETYFLYVT